MTYDFNDVRARALRDASREISALSKSPEFVTPAADIDEAVNEFAMRADYDRMEMSSPPWAEETAYWTFFDDHLARELQKIHQASSSSWRPMSRAIIERMKANGILTSETA